MFNFHILVLVLLVAVLSTSSGASKLTKQFERISYGSNATIEEHPYMVGLYKIKGLNKNIFCGGSLISSTCVLTAAHCVAGFDKYPSFVEVRGGSANHRGKEVGKVQSIEISKEYKYLISHDMDVAIIKLARPFQYSKSIQTIEIDSTDISEGDKITATGWGATEKSLGSEHLQEVNVTVISIEDCREALKRLMLPFTLTENMFCARGNKKSDVCRGDSGSPVTLNGKQVGIVSWKQLALKSCGKLSHPSVYTKLSSNKVKKFLQEATTKLGCNI